MRRDIARQNQESWESFPEAVRYYPAIWNSNRSREECFFTVLTYLDLIYNDFLLQRTLVRRIRAPSDELLRISRLLMTTLLDVIGNRATLKSATCDIAWMVRKDTRAFIDTQGSTRLTRQGRDLRTPLRRRLGSRTSATEPSAWPRQQEFPAVGSHTELECLRRLSGLDPHRRRRQLPALLAGAENAATDP